MAFDTAYPQILANLAAGNEPVAIIDSNFTPVYAGLLLLNTFSNYYADSGAANAYAVTITARQSVTLAVGLSVQFLAANANTGASTLNVNGTGAKSILRPDGGPLQAGDIPSNGIVSVMYDGTQYLLLSVSQPALKVATFTYNVATATGTQAITGTGFKPRVVIFFQGCAGTSSMSFGFDNGTTKLGVGDDSVDAAGCYLPDTTQSIISAPSAGNNAKGHIQSLDTDGFTLSWTKTGAPVATITIGYLAIR